MDVVREGRTGNTCDCKPHPHYFCTAKVAADHAPYFRPRARVFHARRPRPAENSSAVRGEEKRPPAWHGT
eukprot:IDg18663t1